MNTKRAIPAMRFRKNTKRAVSPIIATILLVAITVVLAAVLYVLISGLIHGPGNTPIGSALGLGGATLFTGAGQTGCAGDFCYKVAITSAADGITVGSMTLAIRTTGGTNLVITGTGSATIVSIAAANLAATSVSAGGFSVASWTTGGSTLLVTSDALWLDLGTTANPAGTGLTLYVFGTGSFSGSETVPLP
jgi:flagellin-like protein